MKNPDGKLNNPVWHALTHQQSAIALGGDLARCYPRDIAPFGAVVANTEEALHSLAELIKPDKTVGLVGIQPTISDEWTVLRQMSVVQMVYAGPILETGEAKGAITPLSQADVPTMLQLVELTHPGPFLERTLELGHYLAIWQDGQLAAMAGERFHLPGYREISAVCTNPAFQRRGYARQLIVQLIHEIQDAGEVPFLHVVPENKSAQTLYESLGFIRRAELPLIVLRRQ